MTPDSPAADGQADILAPSASHTLLTLAQNFAIAHATGRDDVASAIEGAITARLIHLENLATFGVMHDSARHAILDMVLGDVATADPAPVGCTCGAPLGAQHGRRCPLVGVPNPDPRP